MVNMNDPRVITTPVLKRLNTKAIANDYNRAISDAAIRRLDPDGFHVLSVALLHEHAGGVKVDPHYRCQVLMKMKGQKDPEVVYLDVEIDTYNSLPTPEQARTLV